MLVSDFEIIITKPFPAALMRPPFGIYGDILKFVDITSSCGARVSISSRQPRYYKYWKYRSQSAIYKLTCVAYKNKIQNRLIALVIKCVKSHIVVVVVCFDDLKFSLSSQFKVTSSARCSSDMPPSKQINGHSFTIFLIVCCSPELQIGEAMHPHVCMLLRHGPASVRNLFNRFHWPWGRSVPHRWMVGSFIWFCHRARQRCRTVVASSGRLDHIRSLDFCRGWG